MLDVVIEISAADDGGLLADCSLEVAGKDVDGLEHAPAHLPPGTRFEVAFVDSEDLAARMRTARAIMRSGFVPVPVTCQDGIPGIGAHRGVPDVSSGAGEGTGIAFVQAADGQFGIFSAVGTSAASPTWAGIAALADQYAGGHLGFINPAIYQIGRGAQYHRAFHDVTKGNNTVKSGSVTVKGFNATRGWDPATGWGSPDAQVLIPLLARYAAR